MPLIDVLVELEYNGIKVDVARLAELSRRYGERLEALEQEIYAAGRPAVQHRLAQAASGGAVRRAEAAGGQEDAKTGPSTDAEVLEELARLHPLPAKILEYRQYAKLKSTYVDALPEMVYPETGRVHASFNRSWRPRPAQFQRSEPAEHPGAHRGRAAKSARRSCPGEEGWLLLAADYSQIELRVLAHFSGDDRLCEAFARDEDIHARVASQVNGVPLEQVTPEMRRAAKAVNFGVVYGQSAFGLAQAAWASTRTRPRSSSTAISRGIRASRNSSAEVLAECRENGYVRTILGGGVRSAACAPAPVGSGISPSAPRSTR